MNRNIKQSLWVLALGIAFSGFSTSGLAAAIPSQQGQDYNHYNHNQNNEDHDNNQRGERWYFQQGLQDGQHDRQYGGNRTDHPQPHSGDNQSAYRDGYQHGFRNIPVNSHNDRSRNANYFEQGLRDGQHDRQYGGNRTDHPQPTSGKQRDAYRDGYKQGFRNTNG